MDNVTLYVEKAEPYCVFLDFVDMDEFLAFKAKCSVQTVEGNEDASMLCLKNINTKLKIKMRRTSTFQVSIDALSQLRWKPSQMGCVRYELDCRTDSFEDAVCSK